MTEISTGRLLSIIDDSGLVTVGDSGLVTVDDIGLMTVDDVGFVVDLDSVASLVDVDIEETLPISSRATTTGDAPTLPGSLVASCE